MKRLIHEAHRRSLWQVLGIYLAASWVALQVVGQLADSIALPEWVEPFAVVLLVIGLPIVLATAFVQERPAADDSMGPDELPPDSVLSSSRQPPAEPIRAGQRLLTWRNAIGGGVLAFLLLGIMVGAFMLLRSAGIGSAGSLVAKGLLDERAPVLVADFASPDSLLGRAATEAFRIDLSQSPAVQVLEPAYLADALARMQRSAGDGMGMDLALELAVREGIPAIVSGEINPAGRGFVLTARLIEPTGGTTLASARETANDTAAVLTAIDGLSKRLRERVGESYASLRADPPLEKVTTSSLEALQRYTEAVHAIQVRGDEEHGMALLEEAVGLDPGFAMAWRKLGVELNNNRASQARVNEALSRAFENRDRLPERERQFAVGSYHTAVTGEIEKAIAAYERVLDRDPSDAWALNNIGILYGRLRDDERNEAYMQRALAADSASHTSFTNLAVVLFRTGKRDEAWDVLERARQRFPDNPALDEWTATAVAGNREFSRADSMFVDLADRYSSHLAVRTRATDRRGVVAGAQGRLREASVLLSEAADLAAESGARDLVLMYALWIGWERLLTANDPKGALEAVSRGLARVPLDSLPVADRPYLSLAEFFALAGRLDTARELLARHDETAPPDQRRRLEQAHLRAEGAIALAGGDALESARLYREADVGDCTVCALPGQALAWDAAGDRDSARVYWKQFLDAGQANRILWDQSLLGPALERSARLADEQDDLEAAALYYGQLADVWESADPELQPRVEAARVRLQEILRERG